MYLLETTEKNMVGESRFDPVRPPHRLGGVAKSRSLFVATRPSCSPHSVGRLKNMVGESRFELPTSCSQGRRANQAALLPDPNFDEEKKL